MLLTCFKWSYMQEKIIWFMYMFKQFPSIFVCVKSHWNTRGQVYTFCFPFVINYREKNKEKKHNGNSGTSITMLLKIEMEPEVLLNGGRHNCSIEVFWFSRVWNYDQERSITQTAYRWQLKHSRWWIIHMNELSLNFYWCYISSALNLHGVQVFFPLRWQHLEKNRPAAVSYQMTSKMRRTSSDDTRYF